MTISPGYGRNELPIALVEAGLLVGAEVGVQAGENAERFLQAGVQRLYLVDLWQQQEGYNDLANVHNVHHFENLKETINRLFPYQFRHTIIMGDSAKSAALIDNESLDFVYIDANHAEEAIRADLAAWIPKVRKGGWVTGHDFVDSGESFGVKTAVMEACRELGVEELFVCDTDTFPNWSFVKP